MAMIIEPRTKHGVFIFLSLCSIFMLLAALTAPSWTQCSATSGTQTSTVQFSLSGIVTSTSTDGIGTQTGSLVTYADQDKTYGGTSNCAKTATLVYVLTVIAIIINGLAVLVYIPSRNRKNRKGEKIMAFDRIVQLFLFSTAILAAAAVGHFNLNLQCLTKVENSTFKQTGSNASNYQATLVSGSVITIVSACCSFLNLTAFYYFRK